MRLRLFGKEIYISVWIKVIFIILVIAGLSAFGFWVEKNKKPAAFSEIPAAGSLPYLPESENNSFLKNEYSFNSSEASSAAGTPSLSNILSASNPATATQGETIQVYIVGEICKPGVYTLPESSILLNLTEDAGGFTPGADKEAVNLAYPLKNNMMIRIPAISDTDKRWIIDSGHTSLSTKAPFNTPEKNNEKININTAGMRELCTLPGIGESTAQKIINYRNENGLFSNIDEITKIDGIKSARYEQIKNFITVG